MANVGTAVFRATADFSQVRTEAKQTEQSIKGMGSATTSTAGTMGTAHGQMNKTSKSVGDTADTAGKKVKDAHTSMGTAAKVAGIAMATAGVLSYLKDAVAGAEKAAAAQRVLANVMKTMGYPEATAHAQKYQETLGKEIAVSKTSVSEVQAKIATFKDLGLTANTTGGYFDRVTAASFDMAKVTGTDATQAAVQLSKAMNSPEMASALSRTGTLTKAEAEHASALAKSGKIEEARSFIMAAVEKQYKGAAAEGVTSGQRLDRAFASISTTIGTALLPVMEVLASAFGAVAGWMSQNEGLMKILGPIIVALGVALLVAAAAVWVMNLALWANPITWIIAAIVLLIVALVALWQNFDTVKDAISRAWDWIKEKTLTAINWIKDGLSAAWDAIKNKVTETWDSITSWLSEKLESLTTFFSEKWDWLKQKTSEAWQSIKDAITAPLKAAQAVINTVLEKVKSIWDTTFGAMGKVISKVKGIVDAAAGGIAAAIGTVIAKIGEMRATLAALPAPVRLLMFGPAGLAMALGGLVPGVGNEDTQPAMLTPGEFVVPKDDVKRIGVSNLVAMTQGGPLRGNFGQAKQTAVPVATGGGVGTTLIVNYPAPEPVSDGLPRTLRNMQFVGAI